MSFWARPTDDIHHHHTPNDGGAVAGLAVVVVFSGYGDKEIAAMHKHYGMATGYTCKGCCNLWRGLYRDKHYIKCKAYGLSHSEATDWRLKYLACGLYNLPFDDNQTCVIDRVRGLRSKPDEPIDGQMEMTV